MTSRERAGEAWNAIWKSDFVNIDHVAAMREIESAIDEAVAEAVKEERAECAKLADGQHADHCADGCMCSAAEDTAEAIRVRGRK